MAEHFSVRNIKQALMGYLALKLPIQLTVRRVYENDDIGFCVADYPETWRKQTTTGLATDPQPVARA
jgi:hypothetical protein